METKTRDSMIPRLRSVPMFSDLRPEDLEILAGMVTLRRCPKGCLIINRNDRGGCMYLLVSGRVKVSLVSGEGRELALNYIEAPGHFGEMSLVDAEPRSADVIAVSDVEVLALDAKDLSSAIQVQPRLALTLIATLSKRLRSTIARLEDLAFHDATHRVARVLLNIATAAYESQGVPLVTGFTHYEVATLAGTSRETASRVISTLGRDGMLATKGRNIVVDMLRLRAYLETE